MGGLVLLTGGTGFFGRAILAELLKQNFEVVAPGRPDFDLLDFGSVKAFLEKTKPQTIVHSAAYYGGLGICMNEPSNLFLINTKMIINLLEAASKVNSINRFMAIGSACSYPGKIDGLLAENEYWEGPLHSSVEAYGFTKKIQYVGIRSFAKQYGWLGQFPQITNLYGEHDVFTEYRSHVAASLIKRFADAFLEEKSQVVNWGSGKPIREFIYVKDAAQAVVKLLQTDYSEVLNIGTGIGTSIKDLSELIAEIVGYKGEIIWDTSKADGIMQKVLDAATMKRVLNWDPPTTLKEGLQKTIAWYMENKEIADSRI